MSYKPMVGARQTLRASTSSLTSAFDSSPTEVRINGFNQLSLLCDLSLDTATSVDIEVDFATPEQGPCGIEVAPAASDWFTRTYLDAASASASSGVMTVPTRKARFQLVATDRYEIPIPTMGQYVRVRAKANGTIGSATLSIVGVEGKA